MILADPANKLQQQLPCTYSTDNERNGPHALLEYGHRRSPSPTKVQAKEMYSDLPIPRAFSGKSKSGQEPQKRANELLLDN